jgi:hypothetical protein
MLYHSMISRFGLGKLTPARTGRADRATSSRALMKTCGDTACQWLCCRANTWVQTVGHALRDASPSADRATAGPVARRGVRPPPTSDCRRVVRYLKGSIDGFWRHHPANTFIS